MSLWEALRTALLDLSLRKFRSILATIGIILGVASVEAMISISEGAKQDALRRLATLGVDNIILRSVKPVAKDTDATKNRQWIMEYGLLRQDLDHVREALPKVRCAVGARNMRVRLLAPGGRQLDVSVLATEPAYLDVTRSAMVRGRFIAAVDEQEQAHVCVLGTKAARKIFGFTDGLGQMLRIAAGEYRVVGILDNPAALPEAGGDDVNNCVFLPLATARAHFGDFSYSVEAGSAEAVKVQLDEIIVRMENMDVLAVTAKRLESYLARTHKLTDYTLLVPEELIRQDLAVRRTWTIVMVVFAGIALVVGGVGIMNIMLANVSERRKEIGTRRALGARRVDIVRQFLLEAAALTTLGGLIGAGGGYLAAKAVTHYAAWPTIITLSAVSLSLAVSSVIGLVFGAWPAWQAAKVSPIEALRAE